MTVETKDNLLMANQCEKCGSTMAFRKRKLASGEISTILICVVCKHYEVVDKSPN